jgi:hypothetical protein
VDLNHQEFVDVAQVEFLELGVHGPAQLQSQLPIQVPIVPELVPRVLKQQEFVYVPKIEFVELIVHDPEQVQIQVAVQATQLPVVVPMIMKQQKSVAVPQVEFVERVVHEPVQMQILVPMAPVPVHEQMQVPMIIKKQKCVDEPQVEFVDKVFELPVKELGIGGLMEIFIGGMPDKSTKEFVVDIIGQYGIVESCELLPCVWGLTVKLKMATAEKAQWIVRNLNRNIAVGLELPIYVGYTMDCGC